MMRTVWPFPVGLLIGAAIMWAYLSDSPPEGGSEGGDPPRQVADDPGEWRERERGDPPPGDDPVESDVRNGNVPEERSARFHLALATADAIVGRLGGFLSEAALALAAGADAEAVQSLVELLPVELRPEALEKLIANHPDQAWFVGELSDLHREAGNLERAFDLLVEELGRTEEDPGELVERLVDLDPIRAAREILDLARRREWDAEILVRVAGSFPLPDHRLLALPFLQRALAEDPLRGDAIDLLAEIEPVEAMQMARRAVDLAPTDPFARARLAEILLNADDRTGAFEAYRGAIDRGGDDEIRRDWMAALLKIDPQRALPVIETEAQSGNDETLGVLARAYLVNGRKSDAFDVYLKAHREDVSDSEWLHHMVVLDPRRTAEILGQELEMRPGVGGDELIGAYAAALLATGERAKAYDMYHEAFQQDSSDWEWLRGLAGSDPARALQVLEGRVRRDPEDVAGAGALGDAYAALGRKVDAIRQYENAIEIGEDSGRWMAALAHVDEGRGLAMLKAAIDADPDDDEMWGALGEAYRGLGRIGDAVKAYDRALELDPSDWEWILGRDRLR